MDDLRSGVIVHTSPNRVPPNAVLLTKEEALKHQHDLVRNWVPKSDVWPITFGAPIAGVCAGAGGVAMNNVFRRHYQLKSMARMSTYLPIAVLPGMAAMLAHSLVTSDILLMNTTCVVCTQTKAIVSQLFLGTFYPCVIAPIACLSFAVRYNTYVVPSFKTHYKHIILDVSTTLKKKTRLLTSLCAFQCIVAFFLLHTQMNSILKIQRKLSQL